MKILIATDGSKFSQAAIDACRSIATAPLTIQRFFATVVPWSNTLSL